MSDGTGDPDVTDSQPVEASRTIDEPRVTVELTASSLAWISIALFSVIVIVGIFRPAEEAVTQIVIGVVLALALDPLVRALQRRGLSRRPAATLVGAGLLTAALVVLLIVGPPAIEQAQKFSDELPQTVQGFYELPVVGNWLEDNDAATSVETFVDELPSRIDDDTIEDTANSLLGTAMGVLIVVAVTFAVLLDGEILVGRLRLLLPPARRARADRVGRLLYQTFGNYFGGSVTVAVMAGLWSLIIALIFDVPLAPVAAMWTMVTNVIPQIGGFLGGAFITILALSVDVPTAIIVCLLFVLYMNFENNVIQPAIVGEAVDLSPPASMLAVLIGGAAAGIPGALIATPLLGTAKRLYFMIRFGEPEEHRERVGLLERLRKLLRRSDPETAS